MIIGYAGHVILQIIFIMRNDLLYALMTVCDAPPCPRMSMKVRFKPFAIDVFIWIINKITMKRHWFCKVVMLTLKILLTDQCKKKEDEDLANPFDR
jgi:hypothetical protein